MYKFQPARVDKKLDGSKKEREEETAKEKEVNREAS